MARRGTYRDEIIEGWPSNVRPIGEDGAKHIGIDPETNELYWGGERVANHKRFASFERGLASAALIFAALGSLAGVIVAAIEIGRTCCGWN